MNSIHVENLEKAYGKFHLAIDDFSVETGGSVGLLGPNGSGKSTLIRLLMGFAWPDRGTVPEGLNTAAAYVPEEPALYPALSAQQHGRMIARLNPGWNDSLYLSHLDELEIDPDIRSGRLSKGGRMKLALALAMARDTDILILDEPASGIDPIMRRTMMEMLARWRTGEGRTLLVATHITESLDRLVDRIVFLENGRIRLIADCDDLYRDYSLVSGGLDIADRCGSVLLGIRKSPYGFTALAGPESDIPPELELLLTRGKPTLEDIMVHTIGGGRI